MSARAGCFSGLGVFVLSADEQLRVQYFTKLHVVKGPGLRFLKPFMYRSAEIVKGKTLGKLDYLKVKDSVSGEEHMERGPKLFFLGAYETIVEQGTCTSLSSTEYVHVEDKATGAKRLVKGPTIWFPEPMESGKKGTAKNLSSTQYILVEDKNTGEKRVVKGPCVWFPMPHETASGIASAVKLGMTDYGVIADNNSGQKRVVKGPCVYFPGPEEQVTKAEGISLSNTEFVLVEDSVTGEKRVEAGPKLWFPGPNDEGEKGSAVSLLSTEYITVEDKITGLRTMVKGPCVWFPKPYESHSQVKTAIVLQADEYAKLKDSESGQRWVVRGKTVLFFEPSWVLLTSKGNPSGVFKAFVLKKYEYVRLLNRATGKVTTHQGEATIFPEADEEALDGDKLCAVDVKVNEYLRVLDQATGDIRIVAGSAQFVPGPHDKILDGGKSKAVNIDEEHAVLVRDKQTGQIRLETENKLFVPGPYESIEEVRELIKLADHEAMIIKDKDGNFQYYFGNESKQTADKPRSFFLPPYAEIVKLCWSRGSRRDKRDLYIDRFDCRGQYMTWEFNCRTKDNVELILEGTIFWQVVDLERMVRTTGDTSGDICNNTRSQFIKHVARVDLKVFMDDLSKICNQVHQENQEFYTSRGVKVHSLEVTRYQCADTKTSAVLQQIIQETTNRMNRLSQAESENEVMMFKMQGQIEQEKLNGEVLKIQHQHADDEAGSMGKAEASKAFAFLADLAKHVPALEDRIEMWSTLRQKDALSTVSEGGANLYYTPKDVNLSIQRTKQELPDVAE